MDIVHGKRKIDKMISFFKMIFKKSAQCVKERRLPFGLKIEMFFYACRLKAAYFWHKRASKPRSPSVYGKSLYASAVNAQGKDFLRKIIEKFGHETFDYLIFAYDETSFDEDVFKKCRIIREKGLKWYFAKKYLTTQFCAPYDYLFFWDDDIDVDGFSVDDFLSVMRRNALQMAQPSLSMDSYYSLEITLTHEHSVGRLTDYVENMVPVFTAEAWTTYWNMLEDGDYYWGWGYTLLGYSICGYKAIGIVDRQSVIHTRPASGSGKKECDRYLEKYGKRTPRSKMISYQDLR